MGPQGRRIGEFVVERELGRGGMGIVYSAVHQKSAERVAVKLLSPHLLPDPRQRRRFQREAYAAAQLQHATLVKVLGHGEVEDGEPYILMEYLDGTSLRQALQSTPSHRLEIELALHISILLADVLDSAHKIGLLHRDIKPSNV
jgi:serine/threonine-protein kinase